MRYARVSMFGSIHVHKIFSTFVAAEQKFVNDFCFKSSHLTFYKGLFLAVWTDFGIFTFLQPGVNTALAEEFLAAIALLCVEYDFLANHTQDILIDRFIFGIYFRYQSA